MTRRSLWLLLSSAALGAAGCGRSLQGPCEGDACPSQRSVTNVFQKTINQQLDLLFVIDDTSAMAPYVADLAAGYAGSATVLAGFPRGLPSLHVGFIPASGCGASTTRAPECGLTPPAQFLVTEACGEPTNFSGPIDGAFACLADFGTAGCAPAQPLAALRRVLAAPPPGWETFLRTTAFLEIVIVSASDDASGTPVSETIDLLRSLKTDPSTIGVAAIGPGDCSADASPPPDAPRVRELAASFGSNGLVGPLCAYMVESAIGNLRGFPLDLGPQCLPGVADTDPATPGLQATCTVEDMVMRPEGVTTTVLPSCDQAPPPCWRIAPASPSSSCGAVFNVDRAPDFCPQWSTRTRVECLGCVDPNDPACALPLP